MNKSFKKWKWITALSVILFVIVFLAGCKKKDPFLQFEGQDFLRPGIYEVGRDIDAGEYLLLQAGTKEGYFEVIYEDTFGNKTLRNGNFSRMYLNVKSGDTLRFQNAALFVSGDGPEIPKDPAANGLDAGQYKAGTDIDAGEYVIIDEERGFNYVERKTLPDVAPDKPEFLYNEIFEYRKHMKIETGEFLSFSAGKLYGRQIAPAVKKNEDGDYEAGQYLVGAEIPAGEYRIQAPGSDMAVWLITTGPEIVFEKAVKGSTASAATIRLNDGQYITLRNGTMQPV